MRWNVLVPQSNGVSIKRRSVATAVFCRNIHFSTLCFTYDGYNNAQFDPHVSPMSIYGLTWVNISLATILSTNTLSVVIDIRLLHML